MIEIKFYQNGFEAHGHALTAPYGQDLVCAGVSAIIIGALNWFDAPDTQVQFDNTDGIRCIVNTKAHPEYAQWFTLIETQLRALAQPDAVKIKKIQGDFYDN